MPPKFLVLDTSGRVGQVAVAEPDRILASRRLDEARRHARDLAPAVAALLAEQGWRPHDLAAVLVSRGPGSYTGLRVGLMSAKTLAYAAQVALVGVETFVAIARQTPAEALTVEVVADAQQEKVYIQEFRRAAPGETPRPATELVVRRLADWLPVRNADAWLTGPGLATYSARLSAGCHLAAPELWEPGLAAVLAVGAERYAAGERDEVWSLEPIYGRPSSAEEKWDAKGLP